MGHRHPSKLKNSEVGHARARWLLRAELAGCVECRREGDKAALADLAPGGMFDSLLTGFALSRVERWRTPGRQPRYPATVYRLATGCERGFWRRPTRDCLRLCTVRGARGGRVDTGPALCELRVMSMNDRSLVLDDIIDALSEDEEV